MMHFPALALILTVLGFSLGNITINTQDGSVTGTRKVVFNIVGIQKTVSIFYGIPYAKPPVDDLRFRKPQRPIPWKGTLDATHKPPSCPQKKFPLRPTNEWDTRYELTTNTSEDCLYLNVWTPEIYEKNGSTTGKRDVIFWIHGGGFTEGGSMMDKYDGSYLATSKDVVFVSINYRLGPFGFLYLGDEEVPGNMGLYDTVMALDWVNRNIEAFGGNPQSVTIIGNSAGGAIVSALLLSPVSRNLFKNAVIQSLSMFSVWSHESKQKSLDNAREFSIRLGCIKADSKHWDSEKSVPSNLVKCLQKLDLSAIDEALSKNLEGRNITITMKPTIDGTFFPQTPFEMVASGNFKTNASIMIGHTFEEGSLLVLGGFIQAGHSENNVTSPAASTLDEEFFISKDVAKGVIKMTLPMLTDLGIDLVQYIYTDWNAIGANDNYRDNIVDFLGDAGIVCPNIAFASAASHFTTVYYYEFSHIAEINNHLPKWSGAVHGDDIPFFFGSVCNSNFKFDNQDKHVSQQMMNHLTSFASTGNPTPDAGTRKWPEFTKEQRFIIYDFPEYEINGVRPRAQECAFFNEIFPKLLRIPGFSKTSTSNQERNSSNGSTYSINIIYLIMLLSLFHIFV